jgi:hypothetical protein
VAAQFACLRDARETGYVCDKVARAVHAVPRDAVAGQRSGFSQERLAQADLLRDIFGPLPYRKTEIDPAWRSPTVVSLAQAAYQERSLPSGHLDNAHLGVLADALEEAGCDNQEVLGHLREQGEIHVRGCWCVDLLNHKE